MSAVVGAVLLLISQFSAGQVEEDGLKVGFLDFN